MELDKMEWQPIETAPEKQEVLLCWVYPDSDPITRIGTMNWRPFADEPPCFKLEIDYGDCGAWVFTARDDAPTHWMPLPNPPIGTEYTVGDKEGDSDVS